jgi:UDP-N-acetyl-D-glucosamine dehydrogenase
LTATVAPFRVALTALVDVHVSVELPPDAIEVGFALIPAVGPLEPTVIAEALNARSKALNGSKILVWGVSYKKDIDDLRESPAITIIEALQKSGASVAYNDPYLPKIGKGRRFDLQMHCVPLESIGQYDCVVILTDHSDYDYRSIVNEAQLVVDTRNATAGISSTRIVRC